jgi:CRP-like cAMP-binding protein
MQALANRPIRNRLLASLSPADLMLLEPRFERVPLKLREVLVRPGEPVERAYFLEAGIASIISTTGDGARLEVGIFGRDGMSAPFLLLGLDRTPQETFMQVEGSALAIDAAPFEAALTQSPSLRLSLLKYVQAFTIQTAHTAVSNGSYQIEERLARWLLMCHDRMDGDELPLTHEFLAMMLAVRRSGVTLAMQSLEGAGIVRANRGRVTILSREKLEEVAGGSYGPAEGEYERLIGPLRRGPPPLRVVSEEGE